MKLSNFYTAYTQALELYGIELTPDAFENIGMTAWEKIGNRTMVTKTVQIPVNNSLVHLPCDADTLEAVTMDTPDFQSTSATKNSWNITPELYSEQYIALRRGDSSGLFTEGKFIKYEVIDPITIKVKQKDGHVNVMYKTQQLDEDDLPLLNYKEVDAIAIYCAYTDTFKKGLMTRDGNMINLAQSLEQKWLKACDHARTPISVSQNDFDAIGDVKMSWDRKTYGKSFKPIR